MGKKLFLTILSIVAFATASKAGELELVQGKVYLMNFDEEIENIHADEKNLDAQIVHTIFDDKRAIILSLKSTNNAILQVKTEKNLYNYNVKNSKKASNTLVEIDIPPFENLDVDIFSGV